MNKAIKFILNETLFSININPATTLLDFIRNVAGLKGTKEGCREGDCGACAVLIGKIENGSLNYKSINSCLFPIANAGNSHIVTIEGLNQVELNPIQKEFNEESATQCGFCTPGFINSLTSYIIENQHLTKKNAENSVAGNICRCTGYSSIKRAIENIVEHFNSLNSPQNDRIPWLVENGILPKYFLEIESRLQQISENKNEIEIKNTIKIAGGTDLFVQKHENLLENNVTFLSKLKLNFFDENEKLVEIGSGTTIEEFRNSDFISEFYPKLKEKLELFASPLIRNSATIGGNLVNASPIGDISIILLAMNAKIKIKQNEDFRIINLNEFFKSYKKVDLAENEIIYSIQIPKQEKPFLFNFEKVSKRIHLDIASVNTAIQITYENYSIKTCKISAGGIAPIPKFLSKTSDFLCGKNITIENIKLATEIVQTEISPISDIRGTENYKRLLLPQLIKSHFIELFPKIIDVRNLI